MHILRELVFVLDEVGIVGVGAGHHGAAGSPKKDPRPDVSTVKKPSSRNQNFATTQMEPFNCISWILNPVQTCNLLEHKMQLIHVKQIIRGKDLDEGNGQGHKVLG